MRTTSDLYKTLLADPAHVKENRLTIGGVIYDESQIVSLSTSEPLFAQDTLSIGGAVAREIDFAAFLDESVPKRAQIIHEVRLITSTQASEWLQKGVYYISTRSRDPLTGVTTVHGFDAMMSAEQEWKPAQTDVFPMPMKEAVEKTAAILHLALDPRNLYKTGEDYKVGYPVADGNASEEEQVKGLSIRQVWRWIAAAMGGNFIINDLGELRLVPVNDATATAYLSDESGDAVTFGGDAILLRVASADSPELSVLENAAASVQQFPSFEAISRVILKISGDQGYVSGSDTGRTIEINCAYGSQTMANDLLAQLQGYVYQPMQADDALIDPAAELGDPVEVCGVYAVLAQKDTLWDMLSAADIAAPGGAGPEDEYGFLSVAASRAQYELAQARSLISKTNDRISMEIYGEDGKGGLSGQASTLRVALGNVSSKVQSLDGAYSQIDQKVDNLTFKVVNVDGTQTSVKLSDGAINLQGLVTIDSLDSGGTTEIDGARIKTGTIEASKIKTGELRVQTIWGDALRKAIVCESRDIHIGGSEGVQFDNVNIRGGTIRFREWYANGGLDVDPLFSQITPIAKDTGSVGSFDLPFGRVHCQSLYLNGTQFDPARANKLQYSKDVFATLDVLKRFVPANSTDYSLGSSDKPWAEARITKLYVNGVQAYENRVTQGNANYIELNSNKQFVPSSASGYSFGSSTLPWANGFFSNLYVGGSQVSASKLANGAAVSAELNGSKAFVPGGATGYSLGSSSLPWAEARVSKLYIGNTEVKAVPSRIGYSITTYADMKAGKDFTPAGTGYSLGSSAMAWDNCYLGRGTIKIGANAFSSGTKIGFYGATPIARQTLSTTSNNMSYTSATSSNYLYILNNIVGILKKLGLIG